MRVDRSGNHCLLYDSSSARMSAEIQHHNRASIPNSLHHARLKRRGEITRFSGFKLHGVPALLRVTQVAQNLFETSGYVVYL